MKKERERKENTERCIGKSSKPTKYNKEIKIKEVKKDEDDYKPESKH